VRAAAFAAALLFLAAGCAQELSGPVLVTVNGEPIRDADLGAERAFLQPLAPPDADLLEDLIDQALLRQEAKRLGISLDAQARRDAEDQARGGTDPELLKASLQAQGLRYEQWVLRVQHAALIEELVRREVRANLELSPQEVQDYYWEHIPNYRSGAKRVLRQIFTRHRAAAEKARGELELGEPFADVAQRRGEGPEADRGGLLGPLSLKSLPKALAEGAARLKPGQYSPILLSPWGCHILYLESELPGRSDSLEAAAPLARAEILEAKEQVAYQAYLARLRGQAQIERRLPSPTPGPASDPSHKDRP
jgi:parvulin-like peptidyl-prolyl isomerase